MGGSGDSSGIIVTPICALEVGPSRRHEPPKTLKPPPCNAISTHRALDGRSSVDILWWTFSVHGQARRQLFPCGDWPAPAVAAAANKLYPDCFAYFWCMVCRWPVAFEVVCRYFAHSKSVQQLCCSPGNTLTMASVYQMALTPSLSKCCCSPFHNSLPYLLVFRLRRIGCRAHSSKHPMHCIFGSARPSVVFLPGQIPP